MAPNPGKGRCPLHSYKCQGEPLETPAELLLLLNGRIKITKSSILDLGQKRILIFPLFGTYFERENLERVGLSSAFKLGNLTKLVELLHGLTL